MSHSMTTKFLTVIAVILTIFGLLYLVSPLTLTQVAGIETTASGLTDIRATYGGFQIGFALFLFWSCGSECRLASALMATGIIFCCVGLSRLYGIFVDSEFSTFNLIGLTFEIALTVVCFYLYRRHFRLQQSTN